MCLLPCFYECVRRQSKDSKRGSTPARFWALFVSTMARFPLIMDVPRKPDGRPMTDPTHGRPLADPWASTLNGWVTHGRPAGNPLAATHEAVLLYVIYARFLNYYNVMGDRWVIHGRPMDDPQVTRGEYLKVMRDPRLIHARPMGYHHEVMGDPRVTHGRPMGYHHKLGGDPRLTHGQSMASAMKSSDPWASISNSWVTHGSPTTHGRPLGWYHSVMGYPWASHGLLIVLTGDAWMIHGLEPSTPG